MRQAVIYAPGDGGPFGGGHARRQPCRHPAASEHHRRCRPRHAALELATARRKSRSELLDMLAPIG
jgi:hypothetical protein